MNTRTLTTPILLGVLLVLFFWFGFMIRGHISMHALAITEHASEEISTADFNIFWETWDTLSRKYPFDEQEPTTSERIYAATAGMVRSFADPHTVFLPPTDAELFTQDVSGAFGGVGMEVDMRNDLVTVVAPLKGSPSEKAGVMPEDIIMAVDGNSVNGMDIDSVIALIRGKKGTSVLLTLLREGESERLDISIVRDIIAIPTIETRALTDNIFYIALYSFTESSPSLMRQALQDFTRSGAKALIFDLRSNPGGYLQAGVEIASMILPEGTVIVKEHNGTEADDIILRSVGYNLLDTDVPMIVLVDGGSASASEIVAGALRDHDRSLMLGTTTFGKGSVQELVELSDQSALKVTVAQWLTPNNISLSEGGLEPDYTIVNRINEDGEFIDEQLQKARRILEKELAS